MIAEGVGYADRNPTAVVRRATTGPQVGEGPRAESKKAATHVGDITVRFHSSDGISSCETKRMRYLRMHMQYADALGGSESGFKDNELPGIAEELKWDHAINADLFHAGYHRKQTGVYLLLSRKADFTQKARRYPLPGETTQLQLLVVDAHLHDTPIRFVVSHAPPAGEPWKKQQHYTDV